MESARIEEIVTARPVNVDIIRRWRKDVGEVSLRGGCGGAAMVLEKRFFAIRIK